MDGRTWHVLRRHRNDTSLEDFSRRAAWPIIDEALLDDDHLDAGGSAGGLGLFRFFRVLQVTIALFVIDGCSDGRVGGWLVRRWRRRWWQRRWQFCTVVIVRNAALVSLFLRGGQCLRLDHYLTFVVVGCLFHALCSLSALRCRWLCHL